MILWFISGIYIAEIEVDASIFDAQAKLLDRKMPFFDESTLQDTILRLKVVAFRRLALSMFSYDDLKSLNYSEVKKKVDDQLIASSSSSRTLIEDSFFLILFLSFR